MTADSSESGLFPIKTSVSRPAAPLMSCSDSQSNFALCHVYNHLKQKQIWGRKVIVKTGKPTIVQAVRNN